MNESFESRVTANITSSHYMQSDGVIMTDDQGEKITCYFYPYLVFPNYINVFAVTLICNGDYKKTNTKVVLDICSKEYPEDGSKPAIASLLSLKDYPEKITLLARSIPCNVLGKPLSIKPMCCFYLYCKGELKDTSLILSLKSV